LARIARGDALTRGSSSEPGVDLDSHIGVALRFAYQRAAATLSDAIRELGLTPIQVSVLARLRQSGPLTQNRLGRSLGMDPPNVRDVVQRLAGRGLVSLDPAPEDRRALLVAATPAGAALFARVWPLAEAANERTLSVLTAAERALLVDMLARLAGGPPRALPKLRVLRRGS
jgi:MarR family transcriptional regulator, lower aerobic nicotinate degradation pathway regulator